MPHEGWTDEDRALAVAWRLYQDGLCPCGCGYPRSQAWDEDMDGWYETHEVICYARAAREAWERDRGETGPGEPGTLVLVEDTRATGV